MRSRFKKRPSPTAIAAIAVFLLLLLILSAGLFRAGGMEIFDNPGSAADWVAAIGTWAVGLAAAWVGWLSHKLQLADRTRRRMDEVRITILQQETIGVAVNNIRYRLDRLLNAVDRESPEHLPEEIIRDTADCAANLSWNREDQYLFRPATRSLMLRAQSLAAALPRREQQADALVANSPSESKRIFINALTPLTKTLSKLEDAIRGDTANNVDIYRRLGDELASHV